MAKAEQKRLAIIGAGPVGLEAALYARHLELEVRVYERGRIGEFVQRWGHVRLFSPFGMNVTPLGKAAIRKDFPDHIFPGDGEYITGRQHLAAYLEPLARSRLLKDIIHTDTQVMQIGRERILKEDLTGDPKRGGHPFHLLVREKGKERIEEADIVLDCSGTYGQHRWMGDGGIPAPGETAAESQICYTLDDVLGERKSTYAGKSVLVYGGGYSAATSVCNLAELAKEHSDTWVIWLARVHASAPIRRIMNDPLRERDRLAVRANTLATRTDANVEFHPQSLIRSIEPLGPDRGFRVTALSGKEEQSWEVDRVIANVGYAPDNNLYRELQVHECYASLGPMKLAAALSKPGPQGAGSGLSTDCLQQVSHGPDSLRNPEPNFFILGAKSYGRNSNFLVRLGFDQVREAFTLIMAKANLDLYRQ